MSKHFPRVPLGKLLNRVERFEKRNELEEYHFAGTYSFARGIFAGERKLGSTFNLDKIQRIYKGDFVYCKIMAWEGTFGIVPKEAHNCVMSGAFVVYEIDRSQIEPPYLAFYFKIASVWKLIGSQSTGTNVRRQTLHPIQFEAATIPLPALEEQRRIVARVEEVAGKIEEARSLRRQTEQASSVLMSAILGDFFKSLARKFEVKSLGDICSRITDGPHKTPDYVPTGIPFVTVKNMVTGQLKFDNLQYITLEDHLEISKRCKPEKGDVLYSKDGATRGVPCFVNTEREFNIFVSVALIKPLHDQVEGRYLCHLLNSSWIKKHMLDKSKGDMIPHIVLREIRRFPVPLPPLPEQRRIVTYLDNLHTKVDEMKRLREGAIKELDAMLPSILDKAFKGEL